MATGYREVAFEVHGRECDDCGSTDYLHVHHKDGDRSNNDPENLQVLCKEHHWDRHRDDVAERSSGPKKRRGVTYGKTEEYRAKLAKRSSGPQKG